MTCLVDNLGINSVGTKTSLKPAGDRPLKSLDTPYLGGLSIL